MHACFSWTETICFYVLFGMPSLQSRSSLADDLGDPPSSGQPTFQLGQRSRSVQDGSTTRTDVPRRLNFASCAEPSRQLNTEALFVLRRWSRKGIRQFTANPTQKRTLRFHFPTHHSIPISTISMQASIAHAQSRQRIFI